LCQGADFKVIASDFPETLDKATFPTPEEYCKENAKRKALDVYNKIKGSNSEPFIVIGSDTIVVQGQNVLEKPKSKENAIHMLTSLQGSSHKVISAIALVVSPSNSLSQEFQLLVDSNQTEVIFDDLTRDEIEIYVHTKDPM